MDKFITINKGTQAGRDKSWHWRNTCKELRIPFVVVYIEGAKISIGASLMHLLSIPKLKLVCNTTEIARDLQALYGQYADNILDYWNANDNYYLFDFIPEASAGQLAERCFDILNAYIAFEPYL